MPYYRCPSCGLTSYSASPAATGCPTCSASLSQEAKLHLVPGLAPNLSRSFPAKARAAQDARRVVSRLPLPERTRDELTLLVSELVTNSITHAGLAEGDDIAMHVTTAADQVRLEVRDGGCGFAPRPAGHRENGGFGFTIVAPLAEAAQ